MKIDKIDSGAVGKRVAPDDDSHGSDSAIFRMLEPREGAGRGGRPSMDEVSLHNFVRSFDGRSTHLSPTHSGCGPSGKTGLPTRKNCGPRDFRKRPSPSDLRTGKFSENKPGFLCSAGRAASSRTPCAGVNGPRPHRGKAPVSPWIKIFPPSIGRCFVVPPEAGCRKCLNLREDL